MKGLLIKVNDYYYLRESYKTGIGGAVCERTLGTTNSQGELGKLSKKNCDEIFGVVDVEKLAKEKYPNDGYADTTLMQKGFIKGFNKAVSLNKDKVFTLEDMRKAYNHGMNNIDGNGCVIDDHDKDFLGTINKIQQPTEIKVEIITEEFESYDEILNKVKKPILDSEGCLILKKI